MKTRITLLLLFLAGLLTAEARAATRTVTTLNDSGTGSLRATIAAANPGDEINFASNVHGTISLTSGHLAITKSLTITGPGADVLTIQRSSNAGTPAMRILFISNGTKDGPTVKIQGLTLAGGLLTDTFGDGGCIYNDASTIELTKCHLRDNRASKNGGAIYNDGFGDDRGAFVTLDSCTLSNNYAAESGGAIYATGTHDGGAPVRLTQCTLFQNGAGLSGRTAYGVQQPGALTGYSTTINLRGCTMIDNGPEGNAPDNGSMVTNGGYIYTFSSIFYSRGSVTFVTQNSGSVYSYGYNLAQPRDNPFLNGPGELYSSDYPVDRAGLQPNGGPVPTLALNAGLAIDRGQAVAAVDARGFPRPYDFPAVENTFDGADIGAYEAHDFVQATDVVTVNAFTDQDDGICGILHCTLREAVARVNALREQTTATDKLKIRFADFAGTVQLNKELVVSGGIQIEGPGARVLALSAINAGPRFDARIFTVGNPLADKGPVVISGLTLRDGFIQGPSGSGNNGIGGAVLNYGNLTVNDCRFENNKVNGSSFSTAGGRGGDGFGGAIQNFGTLALNRCTLSNNAARGGSGGGSPFGERAGNGGSGLGGAISNFGTLALNNCTVAGNKADGAAGSAGFLGGNGGKAVGAIYNAASATMTATTISGNEGTGGAGGDSGSKAGNGSTGTAVGGVSATAGSPTTIRNTIIAANSGRTVSDVEGAFTSQGYNLVGVGEPSTGFGAAGDQVGASSAPLDPKLGSLKNNLGPTDTMELLSGSPAVDAGNSFGLTSDQRGFARPVDLSAANASDGSDIGAFEAPEGLPQPTPEPRLANISTRLRVEAGDNVLIGGFIVTGSAPKRIVVRAIGPSLPLDDRLANPTLELFNGNGTPTAFNDNWQDAPNRQEIIDSAVAPSNDLESAILQDVEPGLHTAVVRGAGGGTGVGLVEVYDIGSTQDSKLANISTRGRVLTGDNVMIGGLIITGSSPQKVILRAIGPSLPLNDTLADPFLELFDGNGNPMSSNNNWKDTQQSEIEATGVAPGSDLESAIVTSLPPALYTAIVSGVNGTTGVALVEAYALQ